MNILIFDRNEAVRDAFRSFPDVDVSNDALDALEVDAVVSPANSFGFMDGGIDYAYSQLFGWHVQAELQRQISALPFGELLVGQALVVPTGFDRIPWLISAPTMRVPNRIYDPNDIMLACRAAVAHAKERGLQSLAFPGMGTGCGQVPAPLAAHAMICGIRNALDPLPSPGSWQEAQHRHFNLVSKSTGQQAGT